MTLGNLFQCLTALMVNFCLFILNHNFHCSKLCLLFLVLSLCTSREHLVPSSLYPPLTAVRSFFIVMNKSIFSQLFLLCPVLQSCFSSTEDHRPGHDAPYVIVELPNSREKITSLNLLALLLTFVHKRAFWLVSFNPVTAVWGYFIPNARLCICLF